LPSPRPGGGVSPVTLICGVDPPKAVGFEKKEEREALGVGVEVEVTPTGV